MDRLALAVFLAAALAVSAAAQPNPGDYVFPSTSGNAVLVVPPGSSAATTLATLFAQPQGLVMAPDNIDLVASGGPGLMRITPTGTVTTLLGVTVNEKLAVDQDGSFLLPGFGTTASALLRVDRSLTVTTIAAGFGTGKARAIAVDVDSGDYLVGDQNLFRITASGVVTSVSTPFTVTGTTDMVSDPRTGHLVAGRGIALVEVDLTTGAVVTLAQLQCTVSGVGVDRRRDLFVVTGLIGLTPGSSGVYTVDRRGTVVSLSRLAGLQDAEVFGSRNIVAGADPTPGQTLSLKFTEPGSAGALYLAAASFSTRPGIPTPAGIVDITPDALFTLSQLAPGIFVNFAGTLDARGTAAAAVVVPAAPGLKGLRFHLGFVTVKGGSIAAIARTAGFTIR
jgi:hypothetical protein